MVCIHFFGSAHMPSKQCKLYSNAGWLKTMGIAGTERGWVSENVEAALFKGELFDWLVNLLFVILILPWLTLRIPSCDVYCALFGPRSNPK